MEVGEAAEVEVVVGDEGVDKCCAFLEWKVESGKWKVKILVEVLGEGGREGGLGGSRDEAPFLEVEKGFAGGVVVEGFDAKVAGDGEEERNRESGKWKVESGK